MKGKVYRRNVNPSIHQAGAAAKDLISSGASKHGVPADKLRRDRRRGRRTRQARRAPSRVQAKIRIAPPPPPARPSPPPPPRCRIPPSVAGRHHGGDLICDVSSDLSVHREGAPAEHYSHSGARLREENRIDTSINGTPALRYRVMPDIFAALIAICSGTARSFERKDCPSFPLPSIQAR